MKYSAFVLGCLVAVLTAFSIGLSPNWTRRSPAANPPQRSFHQMAYDSVRRNVLLFGGAGIPDAQGALVCCYDDTWTWDGESWLQAFSTPHPSARAAHAMAFDVARSQVVLFGGN